MTESKIVVFGSGGHAKVLIDILEKQGSHKIIALVDYRPQHSHLYEYSIITEDDFFANPISKMGFIAVGDNFLRQKIVKKVLSKIPDFIFVTAIHPSAQIARNVSIEEGTCLMAHTSVNSDSRIGRHVIVNTNSSIDHDCTIEDFVSIAPNAALGGNCHVAKCSAVSIGAVVMHGISIGPNSVIGAGATVIRDLEPDGTYVGTPAKKIKSRKPGDKYL